MYLLIIDRSPKIIADFYDYFEPLGHIVDSAYDAKSGLEFALEKQYDAIILDAQLPGKDGMAICRLLRSAGRNTPICLLSFSDSVESKVQGLREGADDYLTKPFALEELEARLLALVRRSRRATTQNLLQVGELIYDPLTMQVARQGRSIDLPPLPMKILEILMRASPAVISRLELERRLWGDNRPGTNALKVHMHTLRMSIDKSFEIAYLHTVHRSGYQLIAPTLGAQPLK